VREEHRLDRQLEVLRSRQDLAEGIGVNYQTIGYLERGEYNPSLELAFRIAATDLQLDAAAYGA